MEALKKTELDRVDKEPDLVAFFAMVFVKAHLDCNSTDLTNQINIIYGKSQMVNARNIGEKAIRIIKKYDRFNPNNYREVIENCLSLLDQTNKIKIKER